MSSAYQRLLVTASAVASKRSRSPHWVLVFILGGLVFAGIPNARAAFVTTNEAGLDSVFSQGSFGSNDIDIRFNPTVTFSNGSLLKPVTHVNDGAKNWATRRLLLRGEAPALFPSPLWNGSGQNVIETAYW